MGDAVGLKSYCTVVEIRRDYMCRALGLLLTFKQCDVDETGQMSSVETGQTSAVETGQMSAAETGQMSPVETRQMYRYSTETGAAPCRNRRRLSCLNL